MKFACIAAFASLRGALLFAVLASIAGAQNQTWIRQLGTADMDRSRAAAPDGAGGVYISGNTRGPITGSAGLWLAHYDGAGNQTWIRRFGAPGDESVYAAAPDGAGGVYVGGQTEASLGGPNTAGFVEAWLAHYDSAGNRTWIRQLGAPGGEDTKLFAAAPDGSGGVYATGRTGGSLGGPTAGGDEAWLARYDGAGNQTWIRQLGTTGNEYANGAASDGSGGVYVTGQTFGSLGGPNAGHMDAWLAHYDGAGIQTWIRQFGSQSGDSARAAAPDGAGGVYLSGWTEGSLGGPNAGDYDAWLAHYDSAGNQTWIRQFGTTREDLAFAAAPDGVGGVHVSGQTYGSLGGPNAGSYDVWLAHYDGAGNQTWIRQLGTLGGESARAAAPDGSGGVYVTGQTDGSLGGPSAGGGPDAWLARYNGLVVTGYCTPAVPNSTGQSGELTATGINAVVANNLTVIANQLSTNSFGFFLTSQAQGFVTQPGGSQGILCLGGAIGRYVEPGQIQNSGPTGSFSLVLDLTTMAHPANPVAVQPGDTWNFQTWYRDANPGPTSNFTNGVSVTFQ